MSSSSITALNSNVIDNVVSQIRKYTTMQPQLGIVCGSGMGDLIDFIENQTVVPYSSVPAFLQTTVSGHAGNFVFGKVGSVQVVVMQGRLHQYEGFSIAQMHIPIRVLKLLGVSIVLLTNAAGGLSDKLQVGDFVVLKDHISPSGMCTGNVLVGPNDERFGPRFPATLDAYDESLREKMLLVAEKLGMKNHVHEGVYFHVMGPTYATNAECKVMCMMGADVVGMSTVPEVFVARHCGLRVVAVSLVTDICNPNCVGLKPLTHEEVLEAAKKNTLKLKKLIQEFIREL
ncbi:Purine nucleoside phosphorylase I inosine and guanosine-specific [Fasciola hepatica]|uniref:Purine nucleoside phosphorylase n=1 Tax=Fasciola hepatica TaxID=6192 RepID=A0A4E0RD11_FASHE|nr:Purine nucleoside phosphorylase I inosine and guanosine-specific [Fasciola hepatica]